MQTQASNKSLSLVDTDSVLADVCFRAPSEVKRELTELLKNRCLRLTVPENAEMRIPVLKKLTLELKGLSIFLPRIRSLIETLAILGFPVGSDGLTEFNNNCQRASVNDC